LPSNYEAHFVMNSEGYLSTELRKVGFNNIYYVPMTNNIFNLTQHIKSNFQILKLILKINPDYIHCNATTASLVGAICGFLTRTKTIYTVHGFPFTDGISKSKQIFYKFLEIFMCFAYRKIICVSEYDRQIGIKVMPFYKNKFVTVHNGISDIESSFKKENFSINKLKIVMISRFCPQKDPYTLIFAVNELIKEGLNIELDLYGYGPELNKVLQTIENQKTDKIKYQGEISDITTILKNYDLYALISNWEGLPIGIIEGMRAGLPIIATNVGGNSELIDNNGFLISRGGIMELRKVIKDIYENKNSLKTLGEKSLHYYQKEFTAEKMAKETFKLYEE